MIGESINSALRLTFETEVSMWRLYFLYYGFCTLAVASLFFAMFCPSSVKLHGSAFEYVDREERTVFGKRLNQMKIEIAKRRYQSKFGTAAGISVDTIAAHQPIPGKPQPLDDPRQEFSRMKSQLASTPTGEIMTEVFVYLKDTRPGVRRLITYLYAFGFAIISVPTLEVFYQVSKSAYKGIIGLTLG